MGGGGLHSRVCAQYTLHSAPLDVIENILAHISAELPRKFLKLLFAPCVAYLGDPTNGNKFSKSFYYTLFQYPYMVYIIIPSETVLVKTRSQSGNSLNLAQK